MAPGSPDRERILLRLIAPARRLEHGDSLADLRPLRQELLALQNRTSRPLTDAERNDLNAVLKSMETLK
jgi:hypothetical protein